VSAGFGCGAGVALAGVIPPRRAAIIAIVLASVAIGAVLGYVVELWESGGWGDLVAGGAAGLAAALAATQVVIGGVRRGGTRSGIALLLLGVGLVIAAFAFIPAVGYLEAIALPLLALRLRRTQPERYAGLRTLAKD
jgi:hypothetical protein